MFKKYKKLGIIKKYVEKVKKGIEQRDEVC